jgi:hypothetical protein
VGADSSDREQRFHAKVIGAWVSQLVHAFLLDPFTIGQRDGPFSHRLALELDTVVLRKYWIRDELTPLRDLRRAVA